jgi:hypothetical protein
MKKKKGIVEVSRNSAVSRDLTTTVAVSDRFETLGAFDNVPPYLAHT